MIFVTYSEIFFANTYLTDPHNVSHDMGQLRLDKRLQAVIPAFKQELSQRPPACAQVYLRK